ISYSSGELQQAIAELSTAREGFVAVFGSASPDVQGTNYWLAAAPADAGRINDANELAAGRDPEALRISLGGLNWPTRLDALRAKIMIHEGRGEGRELLSTSLEQLERDGAPDWMIALFEMR